MFLASAGAISRSLGPSRGRSTESEVRNLAKSVGLGFSALIEHLHNVNLLDDAERERLRNKSLETGTGQ